MNTSDTLPETFEWRGSQWRRGVGDQYFPAEHEENVVLRKMRNECTVWFEKESGIWRASLIPSKDCIARRSTPATPGASPQEALDGEVIVWLMTAFSLPGARELLAEVAVFAGMMRQFAVEVPR